ncbi:MAG: transposase, partial [Myxococcota bacterium]
MRRRYTAEQREQLVSEVRSTGESAGKVARRLGVNPSTAYLWMQAAGGSCGFARVVPAMSRLTAASSVSTLVVN